MRAAGGYRSASVKLCACVCVCYTADWGNVSEQWEGTRPTATRALAVNLDGLSQRLASRPHDPSPLPSFHSHPHPSPRLLVRMALRVADQCASVWPCVCLRLCACLLAYIWHYYGLIARWWWWPNGPSVERKHWRVVSATGAETARRAPTSTKASAVIAGRCKDELAARAPPSDKESFILKGPLSDLSSLLRLDGMTQHKGWEWP